MSRHIRAQTTPTHGSGFHLFTVAMTGHAEEKGFNYRNMYRCCPNAVKESRSKRVGLYRNEQGGFACLTEWSRGTTLQLDTHGYPREQNLPRGSHR